jgi:hypothetical protein
VFRGQNSKNKIKLGGQNLDNLKNYHLNLDHLKNYHLKKKIKKIIRDRYPKFYYYDLAGKSPSPHVKQAQRATSL